jgi:UDP-2,3-diacylglucosamine pyrophosphatase LpxH
MVFLIGVVDNVLAGTPTPASSPYVKPSREQRYIAVISDLHIGPGRHPDGQWFPTEDFRWPEALRGYLDHLSKWGNDEVDLIIAGDFLELWQPPRELECAGRSPELGCTIEESASIVKRVVAGQAKVFKLIGEFSGRGKNRVHIIPGNHDAALVYQRPWSQVAMALKSETGRMNIVTGGVWISADGSVVIEHGHQIGSDANKYEFDSPRVQWPRIAVEKDQIYYLFRPWGERFVQELFNQEENEYPIIDNLSPEASGARFRNADRGFQGKVSDVARFIWFSLWETSLNQDVQVLGSPRDKRKKVSSVPHGWDIIVGRELGYELITGALPDDDPSRKVLLADTQRANELRRGLTGMVSDAQKMSDDEIRAICDQLAIRKRERLCQSSRLGSLVEKTLIPRRWVLEKHLRERKQLYKDMTMFVYGHTHNLEEPWDIDLSSSEIATVANTGAFQRLIDEEAFLRIANSRYKNPSEALRKLSVDDLPPCYTTVLIEYIDGYPEASTLVWRQEENARLGGKIHKPEDCR